MTQKHIVPACPHCKKIVQILACLWHLSCFRQAFKELRIMTAASCYVKMVLHEKRLPFRTHFIDIANGDQYKPSYLGIHALAEVPVLKDGDRIIPDSRHIIDYLEATYTNGLLQRNRLRPTEKFSSKVDHFRELLDKQPAAVITMGSFKNPEFSRRSRLPFVAPVKKQLAANEGRLSGKLRALADKQPEIRDVLLGKADHQDRMYAQMTDKVEFKKVLDEVGLALDEVERELASSTAGNSA